MSRAAVAASPLSPLSMSSNDSTFVGRYGSLPGPDNGTPNDVPYHGGPYGAARPPQTSPPSSQHPSSSTDMSRPSASGSSNRPPSSASSVGMSSDGRMGFNMKPPNRESSRIQFKPEGEEALARHYAALKHYLEDTMQDANGNVKSNRARDKLLRLSVTQFMELSTDVYDELIRREDERTQRLENVPRFLLPRNNFHPKRNQARQKLSTLPTERFRQLATDVFYELERRIPRLAGGDISRPRSTTSNASSRSRAPSRGGMRPPPGPGYGQYPPGPGRGGPPPRMGPNGPMPPYGPGPNGMRRPSEAGSLGRPLPKHFQQSTIVPNKSTMVEDDDMDDDEDAFGLDHVGSGLSQRHSETSAEDKEKMQAQETEIAELKEKLGDLEAKLLTKDQELEKHGNFETERSQWTAQREELEQKHLDAHSLTENLQKELTALKAKMEDEDDVRGQADENLRDLHEQLDDLHEQLAAKHSENGQLQLQLREGAQKTAELQEVQGQIEDLRKQLQARATSPEDKQAIEQLQEDLVKQEKVNMEVREEAMQYLRDMRDLSRQNDEAIEQEEKMAAKIAHLEKENDTWRQRYAKIKAQNKSLRASTMGLGLQTGFDSGGLVRQEGLISEGGLVRDTEVTRFQLAVDELLKVARQNSTENMLESVKSVVVSVQAITTAVQTDGYPSPSASPLNPETNMQQAPPSVGKLKARVTGTANSLITATKQHAASHGLSPVALLDAAASNLTSSVVELIKAVKIRPSSKSEFADLDATDELQSFYDDSLSPSQDKTLHVPVLPPHGPTSAPAQPPNDPTSAGNSAKKGWFGWAGKWGDGSTDDRPQHPSAAGQANGNHGHKQSGHSIDSGSDYDPYR